MATFGKTTIGGSTVSVGANNLVGSGFVAPENGLVTKVTFYSRKVGGIVRKFKVAILDTSGNIITNGISNESISLSLTEDLWYDVTFAASPRVNTGQTYILAFIGNGTINPNHTPTSNNWSVWDDTNSYSAPQNTTDNVPSIGFTNSYSIYATYDPLPPDLSVTETERVYTIDRLPPDGSTDYVFARDEISVLPIVVLANVSEVVTVTESAAAKASDPFIITPETVTVSTTVSVAVSSPRIVTSDSTTISESKTTVVRITKQTSDTVTITESKAALVYYWWYPVALTVGTGSIIGGSLNDVYSDNDANLTLGETTGTPGFSYDFTFNSVPTAHKLQLSLRGYYSGNPGHNVKFQVYNYSSSLWENVTGEVDDIPSDTSEQHYNIVIPYPLTDYVSAGELKLRIVHVTAGSNTHRLYIDEFRLETYEPIVVTSDTITVTEQTNQFVSFPRALVFDTVTVTDQVAASMESYINQFDMLLVISGQPVVDIVVSVAESDALAVTDASQVSIALNPFVYSSTIVTENIVSLVYDPVRYINVQDTLTVYEGLTSLDIYRAIETSRQLIMVEGRLCWLIAGKYSSIPQYVFV